MFHKELSFVLDGYWNTSKKKERKRRGSWWIWSGFFVYKIGRHMKGHSAWLIFVWSIYYQKITDTGGLFLFLIALFTRSKKDGSFLRQASGSFLFGLTVTDRNDWSIFKCKKTWTRECSKLWIQTYTLLSGHYVNKQKQTCHALFAFPLSVEHHKKWKLYPAVHQKQWGTIGGFRFV